MATDVLFALDATNNPFWVSDVLVSQPILGSDDGCVPDPAQAGRGRRAGSRDTGRMDAHDLGPALARLGPITQTSLGKLTIGVHIAAAAVSVLFIGTGLLFLLLLGVDVLPALVPIVLALLFSVPGVVLLIVVILGFLQTQRVDLTVHEHGMTLHQSWWRTRRVRWADVASFRPPSAGGFSAVFDCILRSGHSIRVDRLNLKGKADVHGGTIHHPDVQRVLSAYGAWRQRHSF
ncbi:MAG: hypothetical protein ACTHXF_07320 [Brevibacterium yomogidense]